MVDKSLLNVCLMGLALMLIFTAFQTMWNIQKIILDSIQDEDPSFDGRAYYSLAIYYAVFSVFNWTAPSVISVIGPKFSMVIGGAAYLLITLSFFLPSNIWLMYFCSVILGIGGAIFWTAQGNYLILNSTKKDVSRNSGIFWALLQLSILLGNTFVYFTFKGQEYINVTKRTVVIGALSSILLVGVVVLLLLPKATREKEDNEEEEEDVEEKPEGPWQAFVGATKLFFTRNMLLLSWTFLYTGLVLGFYRGVYSSCIGFTREIYDSKKLGIFLGIGRSGGTSMMIFMILSNANRDHEKHPKFYAVCCVCFAILAISNAILAVISLSIDIGELFDRKELVVVSGIFMGVGEVLGGTLFGVFGNKINTWGRSPAIVAGFVIHACFFMLLFLVLPNTSLFHETYDSACIRPSHSILAIFCSFLLGLGDSMYNIQIYSLLGTMYSDRSAPAIAIWMFLMTLGAASSFMYVESLGLYWQLGILLVSATMGTTTFIIVELLYTKSKP